MCEPHHAVPELTGLMEAQRAALARVAGLQDADGDTLADLMDALHAVAERLAEIAVRVEALERNTTIGGS